MNKKYKYRFKTESELFSEYGEGWNRICGFNSAGEMDYLLGTGVDIPLDSLNNNGEMVFTFNIPCEDGWLINSKMLIKLQKYPTYNKKKLVYE